MALSKSKDAYGKVNAENISGKAVPRKGGLSNQLQSTPQTGMNVPQAFSKTPANPTNSLGSTGKGLQGALSGGARPRRSGRGGRGPTAPTIG